jgi:hypothetical protein
MANTTIGDTVSAYLQPDWQYSSGVDGEKLATVNYKGDKTVLEGTAPAIGDEWIEENVEALAEPSYVVGVSLKSVGNGNDAIMTLQLLLDVREELSWVSVNKPIELHPKVVAAAITEADLRKVELALKDPKQATTHLTGVSAAATALYSVKLKGIESFEVFYPVITTVSQYFAEPDSRMGQANQGKDFLTGNVVQTPLTVYITPPTTDAWGNAFSWVRNPDSFPVDNGIVKLKRQWTGFIGIESWMYGSGTFPP